MSESWTRTARSSSRLARSANCGRAGLAPGRAASEAELQAEVKARLALFKRPVAIRFVPDTLPRNANGKILKKDLKVLFEDRIGVVA